MTVKPRNPYFVGRQAELSRFAGLLAAPGEEHLPLPFGGLTILNVYGHRGVGKSWLLEEFRGLCSQAGIPFAFLDAGRVGDDPAGLLTGLAHRMGLEMPEATGHTFETLLPEFITALYAALKGATVAMLMLDHYDEIAQFDSLVRLLLRHLAQAAPPPNSHRLAPTYPARRSRFIVVIGSRTPLREYWPLDPIYLQPLQEMPLPDFSPEETGQYLQRLGIPNRNHPSFFELTQGYPLALALVTAPESRQSPEIWPVTGQARLLREILRRTLPLEDNPSRRAQAIELLYAAAVVRRFTRPLLAAVLNNHQTDTGQPPLPDALFDRITGLSLVDERGTKTFSLHNVLRQALIAEARAKGMGPRLRRYRRRALSFYAARQPPLDQTQALLSWALDLLFLHHSQVVHDLFFEQASVPLTSVPATFGELDEALDILIQASVNHCRPLPENSAWPERFTPLIRDWLELDRQLHGEALSYCRVVHRGVQITGLVLVLPVTPETGPFLRAKEPLSEWYPAIAPLLEVNGGCALVLPGLSRDRPTTSALLRAVLAQIIEQAPERLFVLNSWPVIDRFMEQLPARLLAQDLAWAGQGYTISALDFGQAGGLGVWLLRLVRQNLGLPARSLSEDWGLFKQALQEALEKLHMFETLAQNPLIDEFGLADEDAPAWERAQALVKMLQATLERMRPSEQETLEDSPFHLLNESYGLVGERWSRFEYGFRPPVKELWRRLHYTRGTYYNRLEEAIAALARAFRRSLEGF